MMVDIFAQERQSKLEVVNWIKAIRAKHQLTQEEFAHRIGATCSQVNRWENGVNRPSKMALKLIHHAFPNGV